MSITVIQTPATYSPCGNPMWAMVSGSSNNLSNYFYGWRVYVDQASTGWTNVSLVRNQQLPDNGWGVYDPSLVIRDYVPSYIEGLSLSDAGVTRDPAWVKFRLESAEYTGTTQISTTQVINTTGFSWVTSIKTNEFPDFDADDYTIADSTKKFLTNSPRTLNIFSDQYQWLAFMQSGSMNIDTGFKIKTYNSAGTLIGDFEITNYYYDTTSDDRNRFLRFGVGPQQLNNVLSGAVTIYTGSLPMITSSVDHYLVSFVQLHGSQLSEEFRYNIIDDNCKYTNVRLHFVNRLGKVDSFNFPLVSRSNVNAERRLYQKALGKVSGTSYTYTPLDRGTVQFYARETETMTVTSDWLTTAEALWLEELFISPLVIWQKEDDTLVSVNVTMNGMEVKKVENDDIINYEISIAVANANET